MKKVLGSLFAIALFSGCATQGTDFYAGVTPFQEADAVLTERQQMRQEIRSLSFDSTHPIERLEELFIKRQQVISKDVEKPSH